MFIMFTISVWLWSYVQLLYSPFSSVHFLLPTNILSFQLLGEFDLKDLNSLVSLLQNITFSSRIKRAPKSLIGSTFFQSSNEAPVFHARDPAQVIVNTPCLELACSWKTFLQSQGQVRWSSTLFVSLEEKPLNSWQNFHLISERWPMRKLQKESHFQKRRWTSSSSEQVGGWTGHQQQFQSYCRRS